MRFVRGEATCRALFWRRLDFGTPELSQMFTSALSAMCQPAWLDHLTNHPPAWHNKYLKY
jgi:hypothetical protein